MSELLSTEDAAKHLSLSAHTLFTWRKTGYGPPYVTLGLTKTIIRYEMDELNLWIERNRVVTKDFESAAKIENPDIDGTADNLY